MGFTESIKRSVSKLTFQDKPLSKKERAQHPLIARDESREQRLIERTHPALRHDVRNRLRTGDSVRSRLRQDSGLSSVVSGDRLEENVIYDYTPTEKMIKKEVLESPEPARRSQRTVSDEVKKVRMPLPSKEVSPQSTRLPDDEEPLGDPILLEGPFEDFEIAKDIYSTAYVIARNSTPDMYSFWPWQNPHMYELWSYLFFIIFSQLFVIITFIFWYPPSVHSETKWEICQDFDTEGCTNEDFNGLTVDLFDRVVRYRQVDTEYPFYTRVFSPADASIQVLRFLAFSWILAQVFLRDYANVVQLLKFRDFNLWFLSKVEQTPRNKWAIVIPIIQFFNALMITSIAICVICAYEDAFDIVINSLAFSFLGEIPEIFSGPLIDFFANTKCPTPEDWGDVYYIVPEYDGEDDDLFTEPTWYRRKDQKKAGLLCDFKYRWNPDIVPQNWIFESRVLKALLIGMPMFAVGMCYCWLSNL